MLFNDLKLKKESLPITIPVFPLSGALLLPGLELPLNIFETKYINMVDDALAEKKLIGMIQPEQKILSGLTKNKNLYKTGCVGKIRAYNETEDGRYLIVLEGITRFEAVEEITTTRGYRRFKVSYDKYDEDFNIKKLRENFDFQISKKDLVLKVENFLVNNKKQDGIEDIETLMNVESGFLVDFLSSYLPFSAQEKQLFLEAESLEVRAKILYKVLGIAEAAAKNSINSKVIH
jgi:Lon protease-like protein